MPKTNCTTHAAQPSSRDFDLDVSGEEAERLDAFITRNIDDLTRSAAQRLIENGCATVDGRAEKSSYRLRPGERVRVTIPPPTEAAPAAESIPLVVLYEDSDLIVIDKPAGMTVHPGAGISSGTLVNALLGHCHDLSGIGGELRPGIVHRIDKDTTGVLVVAKNDRTHDHLSRQFQAHSIKRVYQALVFGSPRADRGKIEAAIGRHPTERTKMSSKARHGKHAVTHWRVLERFPGMSLLQLRLETGRTHQIRVHLSEANFPLVGDKVYGGSSREKGLADPLLRKIARELGRQALHAMVLGFIHPATGQYLEFTAPLPPDLQQILDHLRSAAPKCSPEEPEAPLT
jgi:23S rRNA pseudouridine1911/1915/1917 synthase